MQKIKFIFKSVVNILAHITLVTDDENKLLYFTLEPSELAKSQPGIMLDMVNKLSMALQQQEFNNMQVAFNFADHGHDELITMIPIKPEGDTLDAREKISRLIFLLFGYDKYIKSNDITADFFTKLSRSLNDSQLLAKTKLNTYPNTIRFTNLKELYDLISVILQDLGYCSDDMLDQALIDSATTTAVSCAFCRADVIRKQLVMDFGKFFVLVNYSPFAGCEDKAHFMIVPSNHIEDWRSLSASELAYFYDIAYSLAASIASNTEKPLHKTRGLLQNGLSAGQTVGHSHFHVSSSLETPELFLRKIRLEVKGKKVPPLNSEEMAAMAKKYVPILYQEMYLRRGGAKRILTFSNIYGDMVGQGNLLKEQEERMFRHKLARIIQ